MFVSNVFSAGKLKTEQGLVHVRWSQSVLKTLPDNCICLSGLSTLGRGKNEFKNKSLHAEDKLK